MRELSLREEIAGRLKASRAIDQPWLPGELDRHHGKKIYQFPANLLQRAP